MFPIKFPDKLTFNNPFVVIKNQWGLGWFKINRTYLTIALGRVTDGWHKNIDNAKYEFAIFDHIKEAFHISAH